MSSVPANSNWEYLAVGLLPGDMLLEVLNRHRSDGWEYDRLDLLPVPLAATLYLKRRPLDAIPPAESAVPAGANSSQRHPNARKWTVVDDEIVRTNSAKNAARLLEVSIATIYVRRQQLGLGKPERRRGRSELNEPQQARHGGA